MKLLVHRFHVAELLFTVHLPARDSVLEALLASVVDHLNGHGFSLYDSDGLRVWCGATGYTPVSAPFALLLPKTQKQPFGRRFLVDDQICEAADLTADAIKKLLVDRVPELPEYKSASPDIIVLGKRHRLTSSLVPPHDAVPKGPAIKTSVPTFRRKQRFTSWNRMQASLATPTG